MNLLKKLIPKDSFYLILFACIGVVGASAVWVSKSGQDLAEKPETKLQAKHNSKSQVKAIEEEFGVSAAAMAAPAAAAGAAEAAEEKTEFDVELTETGANKIAVMKVVKAVTGLGLKDAKALVDGAPKVVKEAAAKEEAEDIKKQLEEAGAKVTLK